MKKSELRQMIREEISRSIKERDGFPNGPKVPAGTEQAKAKAMKSSDASAADFKQKLTKLGFKEAPLRRGDKAATLYTPYYLMVNGDLEIFVGKHKEWGFKAILNNKSRRNSQSTYSDERNTASHYDWLVRGIANKEIQ